MFKPSLSLHLIAKNEEKNLPKLIESLKDCIDEIFLTDTGSTDGTVELAQKLGCKVSHFKWINDFAAARNFNFEQGNTDYQLWLDCDDTLGEPEQFKLWRQEIMPLADYHLAKYHYAVDEKTGAPTCTFFRERVIRRGKGFKWKYFLHEGIRPDTAIGPIKQEITHQWSVWHRRTAEDLKADRMRNLTMFKGHERLLDPRMTMYYGKELHEAQFFELSVEWLKKAVTLPQEPQDILIAHQYLGWSLLAQGISADDIFKANGDIKYKEAANKYYLEAFEAFTKGLQIDPNRAEYAVGIGDIFLRLNDAVKAIPWYQLAKHSMQNYSIASTGMLFHAEDAYSKYPRTQLAKLFGNIGNFQAAKKEALELDQLHPSDESKALVNELNMLINLNSPKTGQPQSDDIIITCMAQTPFPWDGVTYRAQFCGGSETAAIELAENMHKLTRRKVIIFNHRDIPITFNGVEYQSVQKIPEYLSGNKPWLHIAWRHNIKLTDAFTILWCHDLFTPGAEDTTKYDWHACLTQFHKRFTMAKVGIPESKIWVTRNGLDPKKFEGEPIEKDPNLFVFSSSPDRGLDRAMLVLDRVKEVYPDIKLRIHYGIEHLDQYGLKDLRLKLKAMMEERPWVQYIGKTSQSDLIKSFKQAAYCVQPSDFIETSMISAMERLACGVYQVIRNVGAVQDTLKYANDNNMATLVDSDCITEKEHDLYAQKVIQAMNEKAYLRVKFDPNSVSWQKVAQEWIEFRQSQTS